MKRAAPYVGLAVVLVAVPFFFTSYRVGQFTLVGAYAVAVLGLNLLVGYSGQISLGHGASFALGAYVSAILITDAGFPPYATVPVAAVVCFGAGFLLGLPALRLRGLYLAILTLGLAVATPQLIKRFDGLTGGTQGINVEQPTAPAWTGLADDQFLYLVTLAFSVVMFVLAARLVRGRVGRALIAIRDNETAARAQGVNPARYKTLAFATGSLYAGVGGALYVFSIGFVAPESFTLVVSFSFLAAVVVGGPGHHRRRGVRGAVHRVRARVRGRRGRGAGGRDLRGGPDRLHVRAAGWRDGRTAQVARQVQRREERQCEADGCWCRWWRR